MITKSYNVYQGAFSTYHEQNKPGEDRGSSFVIFAKDKICDVRYDSVADDIACQYESFMSYRYGCILLVLEGKTC